MTLRSIHRSLQATIAEHGLQPAQPVVLGAIDDEPITVDLHSLELLEVFADAVEKPIVSGDGETFLVAHEVDGVPVLWRVAPQAEAVPA